MGKKILHIMQSLPSFRRSHVVWFLFGVITSWIIISAVLYYKESETLIDLLIKTSSQSQGKRESSGIPIPMEAFPEAPWRTPNTLEVRTVTSTPFARFEIHKVRTENGKIVSDWLWTDEREHVNILVHMKQDNKYMLFYQSKYGLKRKYYAPVGGLFNKGDTPLTCAKRELLEETGLESEELVYLGPYRVQVNRGGGILHAFFAKNCYRSQAWKASDDYEKQERKFLTREQLLNVILSADIGEAQWLATVSTALLYEDYHRSIMRNRTLKAQ